jgi:predicted Zn-dependent peptidase
MPPTLTPTPTDPDTRLATLANGVRVLTIAQPHLDTACVSAFVHAGSRNESLNLSGASHFAEHMAFKGTATRDCQQINLDAELLGADVNAHTDKDHTAYHMRGLAEHAPDFVRMLGDIVCHAAFPPAELERERQVILQELSEIEDDAFDAAFEVFDRMCYGAHPMARPVIGRRGSISRLTREQLQAYVAAHYTGANLIVAAAGRIDPDAVVREAERAFGALPAGASNRVDAPDFRGGTGLRRMAGHSQAHLVLGFPVPAVTAPGHAAARVAAAVLGEGMSSPLMDNLRERQGLVYYAGCSADADELAGQFVLEASMAPEHLVACTDEMLRLLRLLAEGISPTHWQRAHNQLAVRELRQWERPARRLEDAVLDCFAHGRVRSRGERRALRESVDRGQVEQLFALLLAGPMAVGAAGRLPVAAQARLKELGKR